MVISYLLTNKNFSESTLLVYINSWCPVVCVSALEI